MVDKPDPERDKKLSEHIMNLHNQNRKKPSKTENIKQLNIKSSHRSLNEKYVRYSEINGKSYSL